MKLLNRKHYKGNLSEAMAIVHLMKKGNLVFKTLHDTGCVDFVTIDKHGKIHLYDVNWKAVPGGQCSSGQWTNGERLEVCVQWKMENHPAARKTAAPAPAPSPRAWDGPEWRLAMELCPRYADYGQWSLRII